MDDQIKITVNEEDNYVTVENKFYRLAMIGSDIFIPVVLKTLSQGASKLKDVLLKMLSFEHLFR